MDSRSSKTVPELKSMVSKVMGIDQVIDGIVNRLGDLELAYLIDDYAEGKDTGIIDLVLVGNIDEENLIDLVHKTERYIDRKIRTLILSNKEWKDLTRNCLKQIEDLSKNLKINKKTIKIDKYHTYMIGKYGPIIKYENNKDIKFLKVMENIDINKLENGEYKIDEIILKDKKNGRCLGRKENKEVLLKEGKYGLYLEWNNQKISVNIEDKNFDTINFEDIENLLINIMKRKSFTHHEALLYIRNNATNSNNYLETLHYIKTIVSKQKPQIINYFEVKNA